MSNRRSLAPKPPKLLPASSSEEETLPDLPETPELEGEPNWEKCFWALAGSIATGGRTGLALHTSQEMSEWVQAVHDYGDPRVAKKLLAAFERFRSPFIQNFMG